MRQFDLPPPTFIKAFGELTMVTVGEKDDYLCPDCGQHLCWLDYLIPGMWICERCSTDEEDDSSD